MDEREQLDELKSWWQENRFWILSGLAIGVLALVGWNQWGNYQLTRSEQGQASYAALTRAVAAGNDVDIQSRLDDLESDFSATPYLDQARLLVASRLVEAGDLAAAAEQLDSVVRSTSDRELELVARLRHARVLLALGETDRALGLLSGGGSGTFSARYAEVRGDIQLARGDTAAARGEYEAALADTDPAGALDRAMVEMKLAELAESDAAREAPADAITVSAAEPAPEPAAEPAEGDDES